MGADLIHIDVNGPLAVKDAQGKSLLPRGRKAQGLIALLAFARDFKRSRIWLQDKLWSDRGSEQAAGSLRQVLTEIRGAFGAYRTALICDAGWVQLDPARVSVSPFSVMVDGTELLEGLDIRDPEFDNWLRDLRQQAQPVTTISAPKCDTTPTLFLRCNACETVKRQDEAQFLRDDVIRTLQEYRSYQIIDLDGQTGPDARAVGASLLLDIQTVEIDGAGLVSLKLRDLTTCQTVWASSPTDLHQLSEDGRIWHLRNLAQQAMMRICDAFDEMGSDVRADLTAASLANQALKSLFAFSRKDLKQADHLLAAAYKLHPKGVYLSWRSFIRRTAVFEHLTDAFLDPLDHRLLHAQALQDDPDNSYTLVFAGQQSFVGDGDARLAELLCNRALEVNPGNPMGWAFRSNVLILLGHVDLAAVAAHRGRILSKGLPCQSSLLLHSCIAETAKQQYDAAHRLGQFSQLTQKNCQAMNRFMFALNTALDRPADIETQLKRIRIRESTFEPVHLLERSYPTWTLQNMPIADQLAAR